MDGHYLKRSAQHSMNMFSYIKQNISLKYVIITAATILFVFNVFFFWISRREQKFILEQVEKQAIILHQQIVLTRNWVSDHDYILVKKKDNGKLIESFLDNPEINDIYGTVYTKVTPARLTRQLSGYAKKNNLYDFNLTNFKSLNPANRPDDFEKEAMRLFISEGNKGIGRIEARNGQSVFRYAAPLIIKESCLACHNTQNYRVGSVGGCISVFIPCDDALSAIRNNSFFLFCSMIFFSGAVVFILFFFTQRLMLKPIKEISAFTRRIRTEGLADQEFEIKGDELEEFASLCEMIDKKLKNRQNELQQKIQEATQDLYTTNLKLKQANKELAALNSAKAEFFSDISHELRTPLTSIKGAIDLLLRKPSSKDSTYVEIISKNTDHLIRTIVDFLDYSKIEAGRLELYRADDSLTDIAQEVIEAQKVDAIQKKINIELDAPEKFIMPLDRHRLYQVISNLLSNAIKFSRERGNIFIRIRRIKGGIKFVIQDEGPGIAKEHHGSIFKKFYQAPQDNNSMNMQKGSSGIGLAICKGLVEAHGGKIRVESAGRAGSKFIFTLPLQEPVYL